MRETQKKVTQQQDYHGYGQSLTALESIPQPLTTTRNAGVKCLEIFRYFPVELLCCT